MKTKSIQITITVATVLLACNLQAQYTLGWFTLGGGGGMTSGGDYTLDGTVGQPAVGNLSGGNYSLAGGFWSGVIAAPKLSIARDGDEVILSWPGSGFVLQSAAEATGPWGDFSPGTAADGIQYRVNTAISGQKRFFRLRATE